MPEELENESMQEESEVEEQESSEVEAEEPEPKPKEKHVPLAELQAERAQRQQLANELQALRMQVANMQLTTQQRQAVLDPQQEELRKILLPILEAERAPERERVRALEEANATLQQVLQADTNINIIRNELGSEWDDARVLMSRYLEGVSERTRNVYLENPELFVDKARALVRDAKKSGSISKSVQKSKTKHEAGSGQSGSHTKPFDPSELSDAEFKKYLAKRGIL